MAGFLAGLLGGGETIKGALEGAGSLAKDVGEAIRGTNPEIDLKLSEIDAKIALAQAEINKVEAQSTSKFVSWWRPALGWCCTFAMAYNFLLAPLVNQVLIWLGKTVTLQALDIGPLITLLIGMLGMAGLRTLEKANGTQAHH